MNENMERFFFAVYICNVILIIIKFAISTTIYISISKENKIILIKKP